MLHLLMKALRPWGPVVMAALLAGCAQGTFLLAPSPAPLLHDALFGHPDRPADADAVFTLDEAMRAHLRKVLPGQVRPADRPTALAESLLPGHGLALTYDASRTRNASQAFAERAGNCLSLVVMTAALAREAGLDVAFQQAQSSEVVDRVDNLILVSGHVNVVLGPHQSAPIVPGVSVANRTDRLQIDFAPPEDLRGLRMAPIDERRVLAMFMNNRAVEALLAQRPAEAYAWVRESVQRDATFWPAYNTLGVVYQRAGYLGEAKAAFERAVDNDPRNLAALGNLQQTRFKTKLAALRAVQMP